MHRAALGWSARATLTNQLRAILLERGTVIAQRRHKLEQAVDALLADPDFMSGSRVRRLLADMRQEWIDLDRRIRALDREFVELARDNVAARPLTSIPGIGTSQRYRTRSCCWRRRNLRQGSRSWPMAGARPATAHDRRQAEIALVSPSAATNTCAHYRSIGQGRLAVTGPKLVT